MRRLRLILLGGILAVLGGFLSLQVVLASDSSLLADEMINKLVMSEPDFTPTPPQLKFIKFQLEDSTRADGCQTAAEFALVMNFGAPADLNEIQLQIGTWNKDLAASNLLPSGESLVLYNEYFKGTGSCATNTAAISWLDTQPYKMAVRTLKSGIFQTERVRLVLKDRPEVVIDEVNLSELQTAKSHDTLVAQTTAGAEVILQDGRVVWRSLRAHIPEQHWLNYGSLVLYEELEPEPKNLCQGLVLSEIAVNLALDKQFIEIHNPTNEIIVLQGCRLWTNWSGSSEYVFGEIDLLDQQHLAVFLKDTKLQLSRTDTVRVELRNENGAVVDAVALEPQVPNSSQALLAGQLVRTFAPTPNLINIDLPELNCNSGYIFNAAAGACQKSTAVSGATDEELVCASGYEVGFTGTCVKVCAAGYERNSETNRCRKVVDELETTLAPCPLGYYRNPETNRCRKITTTTQVGLAPCPIGYERNPDTNRCRKISNQQDCDDGYEIGFTGTCVKKCDEGYERSAETNRCRKLVAQASESDVMGALAPLTDDSNSTPLVKLQWWQIVLAAVTVLILGLIYYREAVTKWLKGRKK